ncbi:helix-turn-helix transcriptional regulator [Aurantiacibacter sp. MUD61]|uniref:helix-turn-helix transcriptional regulator n=1 Tax=Aurantiacibacter sp. MUD61 TaxID=3009083 RepID=UPI0022F044D7|nr:hypothetical protein [Aurantiacibacter sp. MUD61]
MNKGPQISSQTGATKSGAPLAMSRAPAEYLRPWLYWWSISEGELPPGVRVNCGRTVDHPCITFIYHDAWTAGTADGEQVWDPGEHGKALYFGPQMRRMPLSIAGKYTAIALHFNVGAAQLLGFPPPSETIDRIIDLDEYFERDVPLAKLVPLSNDYETWLAVLEQDFLRPLVAQNGGERPDAISRAFETACLAEPQITVEEFSSRQSVSKRTVERCIKQSFGITPKQALRRARALDMAAALLGVARPEDQPEIEDRYFDQSHQIKEVRAFFGMSPTELKNGMHPFLRLALEVRQRRRLDALNRLGPEELGPWRDADSEPRSGDSRD